MAVRLSVYLRGLFDLVYAPLARAVPVGGDPLDVDGGDIVNIKTASFASTPNTTGTTGAVTVDFSAAQNYVQQEPTGAIVYTFVDPPGPCHCQIFIDSDGTSTSRAFTLPGNVTQYGQAFTATVANKKHFLNFWFDGAGYHLGWMPQV